MPRAAETPGQPARNRIQVLLTDADLADIEARQGTVSTSSFCRTLIREALTRHPVTHDHDHTKGALVSQFTVKGRTTRYYRCTGCPQEITEES
jgi:hypothetical protein